MWKWSRGLLGHVTANVECTTNALEQRQTINTHEVGVVGDLQVVVDLGQEGESQVVELVVTDNGKGLADFSQVGCREGLETVVVETKGAVELHQGGHRDGTAEAECQVGGPDQVGQRDLDSLVVVREVERVGDIAQLHGDVVDVLVVGNLERLGLDDVDAGEGADSSVLDINLLGSLDGCGEANALEVGQSVPLDGVDLLELGEVDAVKAGQAIQVHLAVELLEVGGTDALDVGVGRGDEVAVEDLEAAKGDVVGCARCNGNAAGEGGARGYGGRVTSVLDRHGRGSAALGYGDCVSRLAGCHGAAQCEANVPKAVPAAARAGRTNFMMEGMIVAVEGYRSRVSVNGSSREAAGAKAGRATNVVILRVVVWSRRGRAKSCGWGEGCLQRVEETANEGIKTSKVGCETGKVDCRQSEGG
jgi:hypothetical protein